MSSRSLVSELLSLERCLAAVELERDEAQSTSKAAAVAIERALKQHKELEARVKRGGILPEDEKRLRADMDSEAALLVAKQADKKAADYEAGNCDRIAGDVRARIDAVYGDIRVKVLTTNTNAPGCLREAIFSILHELASLFDLTFFIYAPRSEVPHFTSWEQRVTSSIKHMAGKFTEVHRAVANALNKIASGTDIAQNDAKWAWLVDEVEAAFVHVAARVLDANLSQYKRVVTGKDVAPLFSVNVKLTASCQLVLSPVMAETWKLLEPLVVAAFDCAQLQHLRDIVTVKAAAPSSTGGTPRAPLGRASGLPSSGADALHIRPGTESIDAALRAAPALAEHVQEMRRASNLMDARIVEALNELEATHGHLWSPQAAEMSSAALIASRASVENDWVLQQGIVVERCVLLNTFQVQDTLCSMIGQTLTRARARELAAQLEDVTAHVDDSSVRAMRQALPNSLLPNGAGRAFTLAKSRIAADTTKAPALAIGSTRAGAAPANSTNNSNTTPRDNGDKLAASGSTNSNSNQQAPPQPDSGRRGAASSNRTVLEPVTVSPRPSTTPVGSRRQPLVREAARGESVAQTQSTAKASSGGGPNTPNPKSRTSAMDRSELETSTESAGASRNSNSTAAARNAWDSPPRPAATRPAVATPPDDSRPADSPSSAARTNATLRMTSDPSAGTTTQRRLLHDDEDAAELDRLARKERESLDRLKALRMNAERRSHESAPLAPSAEEMRRREAERAKLTPPASPASSKPPRSPAKTNTTAPDATEDENADDRRQRRTAQLHNERMARERQLLLESQRAQDRRREEEVRQAESEMDAKMRKEQEARAARLAEERTEERLRREAAEVERRRREEQRADDEAREAALRQRLDELEKKRRAGQERLNSAGATRGSTTTTTSSSSVAAPPPAQASSPSNTAQRPPSRGYDTGLPSSARSTSGSNPSTPTRSQNPYGMRNQQLPKVYANDAAPRAEPAGDPNATSALRKKLALPPVDRSAGAQAEQQQQPQRLSSTPSPCGSQPSTPKRHAATPQQGATRPPLAAASPNTVPTSASASPMSGGAAAAVADIDTAGKSLLEVYRNYCAALNIKPNSGLLKILPNEPGKFVKSINLDLNYIGVRGVRPLIEILRINRGLVFLNLKDNNLENTEVRQLVNVLLGEAGRQIEHVDLSNNPISLAGGSAIMDLVTAQPTLRTVVLRGTLIQAKVVEKIADAAARNGTAAAVAAK